MKLALVTLLSLSISVIGFSQCEDFEMTFEVYHPTCFGFADGSVSISSISGGTEPYSVNVTNSDGFMVDAGLNVLTADWYYIVVLDGMGCELIDSVELLNPLPIDTDNHTIVDHSSMGECDGSITINDIPGYDMAALYFFWNPDPDSQSGLGANEYLDACPGGYILTINSDAGCSTVDEFTVGGETTSLAKNAVDQNIRVSTRFGEWTVLNEMDASEGSLEIQIFDLLGKQVYQSDLVIGINNFQLSQSGMFIYKISQRGELVKTGQVIQE